MAFRATPERVRYTSNPIGQQSLFEPGGSVHKQVREIGEEALMLAGETCPVRAGDLRMGNRMLPVSQGHHYCRFTLYNEVPYAKYVMYGTQGPIRSTRYPVGGHMMVRPAPHSYFNRYTPLVEVSGQEPNNWLMRAAELVLGWHGIA